MLFRLCFLLILGSFFSVKAQFLEVPILYVPPSDSSALIFEIAPEPAVSPLLNYQKYKIRKQAFGTILGVQRGEITNIVMGGEFHWRKIRFKHPTLLAANFMVEYNIGNNIAGYRVGVYYKVGRVALTYGGSFVYVTGLEGVGSAGLTPSLGFRLVGFHFTTGYNFFFSQENLEKANTFHVGLSYYFPIFSDTDVKRNKKKTKKDDNFFQRIFKKKIE